VSIGRNDIIFSLALVTAIWFALAGMVWVYWAAVVIAYPFGLISYLLWRGIRTEKRKRARVIPVILSLGGMLSIGMLIYLLIWE